MLTKCRSTREDEFVRHVLVPGASRTHCARRRLSRPRSLHRVDVVGYTPRYARYRRCPHRRSDRGFLHVVTGADGAGTSVRCAFRSLPRSARGRCRKNVSLIPTKPNSTSVQTLTPTPDSTPHLSDTAQTFISDHQNLGGWLRWKAARSDSWAC